jgi:flavin reductase (DIM6/NTAB) family NADH-FMN oxidoreductase RutF
MKFKTFNLSKLPVNEVQELLTSSIAPRPIAFVSTISASGELNLSPFSFFNAFGANPPLLIFSPARKGRDGSLKHTYLNIKEVDEVVVNVVSFDMVEQMNLSSAEFDKGVSEFEKAGFTPLASDLVKPFRVMESPIQMECKVIQIIETGEEGGAGNLVICRILKIHVQKDVLAENGKIDGYKLDLVGRMGGDDYVRTRAAMFKIPKPIAKVGMGIDALPDFIRCTENLNGNELARMGGLEKLPSIEKVAQYRNDMKLKNSKIEVKDFVYASMLIAENQIEEAILHLLAANAHGI